MWGRHESRFGRNSLSGDEHAPQPLHKIQFFSSFPELDVRTSGLQAPSPTSGPLILPVLA